jgi:tape measure domain-containing protein
MGIISLGKAAFELGIDAGGFANGLTDMGAKVAGFANKTTGTMGGVSKAFSSLDDGVFNVTKTFERMTRGVRSADPALRRAQEGLYTYRQEQNRLEQAVNTTQARLKQQDAAFVQSSQRLVTQASNITALIARERELHVNYNQGTAALQRMIASGKASADQIAKATARVDSMGASWLRQIEVIKSAKARLDTMRESHKTLNEQINLTKERLTSLGERQKRTDNAYELQSDRIKSLKERIKAKTMQQEGEAKATDKVGQASRNLNGTFKTLHDQTNIQTAAFHKLGTAAKTAGAAVVGVGSKVSGILTVAFGTVLGTAMNGAAGSVQGFVQSGLDAYMSFERLDKSLQQLVATELRTKDSSLTMTQALDMASSTSKELIAWTQKLAIESPFSQAGVAQAFQMGKALGFNVDEAKRLTQTLIDWSAATGKNEDAMQRVTLALGQMQAKGKVSGEELMQLTEAGLPVREILAKAFGVTTQKLVEMQEDGLIPAQDAIAAIADSLDNDFSGAAKRSSSTMTGLLNSLQDLTTVSIREFFTSTFEQIQPYLKDFTDTLGNPAVIASIKEIGGALGSSIGEGLKWLTEVAIPGFIAGFQNIAPMIQEGLAYIINFSSEAYNWGSDLMSQYGQGIIDAASFVIDAVMSIANTIMDWMMPHSPPKFLPHIGDWGRETAQLYFDSFGDADFGAIKDIGSRVEEMLGGLQASGEIDKDFNIASAVLGSRSAMQDAIVEFKRFGVVTMATLDRIRQSGGPVGNLLANYAVSMLKAGAANEALTKAQEELNRVTAVYDKRLGAINDRMRALQGTQNAKDIDKQIFILQRRMANAARLPASLRPDMEKLQREIEMLQLQKEQEQVEGEKRAAEKVEQVKIDAAQVAADLANAEFAQRQKLIDQQQEQIKLIQEQIDLEKKAAEGPEEDPDAAAKAAEDYAYHIADQAGKLEILRNRQNSAKEGSKEWYDLQTDIYDLEQSMAKDSEKESDRAASQSEKDAKQAEAEAKRLAAEAKRLEDAEFAAEMAAAGTTEQMAMLQGKLDSLTPGTEEYFKVKKQLTQLEEKAAAEAERAAKEQEKLDEKALKDSQNLTDAEWEANFAAKDRAGQIVMLQEKLGGLEKGTEEYYDTLKKLNSLEKAEAKADAAGGKKKGPKGGMPDAGSLYDSPLGKLKDEVVEVQEKFTTLGDKIKKFFGPVKERADALGNSFSRFKERLGNIGGEFDRFKGILGAVAGTLAVLATHIFWNQIVAFAVKLRPLVMLFASLLSPLGLLVIAVAALGAAWATNFGGIREIVGEVWEKAKPFFDDLLLIMGEVKDAFSSGGIEGGFAKLGEMLPSIGENIGKIFGTIWEGIQAFFQSEDMQKLITAIMDLLARMGEWMLNTGLPFLLRVFGGIWGAIAAAAIQYGPIILNAIGSWLQNLGKWFEDNSPMLRVAVSGLLVLFAHYLVVGAVFLLDALSKFGNYILENIVPAIPDLVSELVTMVMALGIWFLSDGLPMIAGYIGKFLTDGMASITKILPGLGLSVGRLIGSTLTKALALAIYGLLNLPSWISSIATWLWNFFLPALGNLFIALFEGAVGLLLGVLIGIWEPVKQAASAVVTDIGKSIMDSLGISIDENTLTLISAFIGAFDNALTWVKEFLGIEGDGGASGKFYEIGESILNGLAMGWNSIVAEFNRGIDLFLNGLAAAFGTNKETIVNIISSLYTDITTWWNRLVGDIETLVGGFIRNSVDMFLNYHNNLAQVASDIWNGLVGAAGWFTRINADIIAFFMDILNLVTGNGGSFPVLKDKIFKIGNDLWQGLVGASGWMTKIKSDSIKVFTDLLIDSLKIYNDLLAGMTKFGVDVWLILLGTDGWITKLVTGFPEKIGEMIQEAKDTLNGFADWIANGVSGFGKDVYDATLVIGKTIIDAIKDSITDGWGSFKNWFKDLFRDWFDNMVSNLIGSSTGGGSGGGDKEVADEPPGNNALGTHSWRGGRTWVGEEGPELVTLPRGSRINTNGGSMSMIDRMANQVAAQLSSMANSSGNALSRLASGGGSGQLGVGGGGNTHERHDHWNLTINTKAETESVIQDYATMRALSGVRR